MVYLLDLDLAENEILPRPFITIDINNYTYYTVIYNTLLYYSRYVSHIYNNITAVYNIIPPSANSYADFVDNGKGSKQNLAYRTTNTQDSIPPLDELPT